MNDRTILEETQEECTTQRGLKSGKSRAIAGKPVRREAVLLKWVPELIPSASKETPRVIGSGIVELSSPSDLLTLKITYDTPVQNVRFHNGHDTIRIWSDNITSVEIRNFPTFAFPFHAFEIEANGKCSHDNISLESSMYDLKDEWFPHSGVFLEFECVIIITRGGETINAERIVMHMMLHEQVVILKNHTYVKTYHPSIVRFEYTALFSFITHKCNENKGGSQCQR